MYTKIDELVAAICQDNAFISFKKSEKLLHDASIMALLSRHQILQEDYLKMKQYEKYVSNDELKQSLLEVKKEMSSHPIIQKYYDDYHCFNELLDEVTRLVFDGISDELSFGTCL